MAVAAGSQLAGRLAVVRVPLPDVRKEWTGWGFMQLVECARVRRPSDAERPLDCRPSPGVICTPSTQVRAWPAGRVLEPGV